MISILIFFGKINILQAFGYLTCGGMVILITYLIEKLLEYIEEKIGELGKKKFDINEKNLIIFRKSMVGILGIITLCRIM
jgi:hypothetical protein